MSDSKNILVVDDDPFVQEMLSFLLETEGYAAAIAGDGAEALRMLSEQGGFDLLITDLHMPGMDGLTLVKEARAAGMSIPVLVLSGSADTADLGGITGASILAKDENIQDTVVPAVQRILGGL